MTVHASLLTELCLRIVAELKHGRIAHECTQWLLKCLFMCLEKVVIR